MTLERGQAQPMIFEMEECQVTRVRYDSACPQREDDVP